MAVIEMKLGNQKALELYYKSLEINKKCLGGDHEAVARTYVNVGIVLKK